MFKWFQKNKRKKDIMKSCGCICYCPKCNDILNDQADCLDFNFVYYHCNVCGHDSVWNFDIAAMPILLKGI